MSYVKATTTKARRPWLYARQQGRCIICAEPMLPLDGPLTDPLSATIEHVIPRASGGTDAAANVALSHYRCNCARGDATPTLEEFDKLAAIHGREAVEQMLEAWLMHVAQVLQRYNWPRLQAREWLREGPAPENCRTCLHAPADRRETPCATCPNPDGSYRRWQPRPAAEAPAITPITNHGHERASHD